MIAPQFQIDLGQIHHRGIVVASSILTHEQSVPMELHMLQRSKWRKYLQADIADKFVHPFEEVITHGSDLLSLCLFRNLFPYLFKCKTKPRFNASSSSSSSSVTVKDEDGNSFAKLDDHVLSLITSFLDEVNLAISFSRCCKRFRTHLVSKIFLERILGRSFSDVIHRITPETIVAAEKLSLIVIVNDLSDAFAAISRFWSTSYSQIEALSKNFKESENESVIDRVLVNLYRQVNNPVQRLEWMIFLFKARSTMMNLLKQDLNQTYEACHTIFESTLTIDILNACETLTVALTGGKRTEYDKAFYSSGFSNLAHLKSRFNMDFTGIHAILYILYQKYDTSKKREILVQDFHNLLKAFNVLVKRQNNEVGSVSVQVNHLLSRFDYFENQIKRLNTSSELEAQIRVGFSLLKGLRYQIENKTHLISFLEHKMRAYLFGIPNQILVDDALGPIQEFLHKSCEILDSYPLEHILKRTIENDLFLEQKAVGEIAANVASRKDDVKIPVSKEFIDTKESVVKSIDRFQNEWKSARSEREEEIRSVITSARDSELVETAKRRLSNLVTRRLEALPKSSEAQQETDLSVLPPYNESDRESASATFSGPTPDDYFSKRKYAIIQIGNRPVVEIKNRPTGEVGNRPVIQVQNRPVEVPQRKTSSNKSWIRIFYDIDLSLDSIWIQARKSYVVCNRPEIFDLLARIFSRGPMVDGTRVVNKTTTFKPFTNDEFHGIVKTNTVIDYTKTSTNLVRLASQMGDMHHTSLLSVVNVVNTATTTTTTNTTTTKISLASVSTVEVDISSTEKYPVQSIRQWKKQDGELKNRNIYPDQLEKYILPDDFKNTFGMTYVEFKSLQDWKRKELKKKVDLF